MAPWEIREGHVLDVLADMPPESVQCVVTSPPYWGLRDYEVKAQAWGPSLDCDHVWNEELPPRRNTGSGRLCHRCGAWLGCLGLEPNPALYVEHLVDVFAEVRRVLRRDGTLWLNLGDSYAASRSGAAGDKTTLDGSRCAPEESRRAMEAAGRPNRRWHFQPWGVKPKDLVGIPWRVAFALQAVGWWLRSGSVWDKGNAMPESVRDRPTMSHEFIFLLTKSARYFYDSDAAREPYQYGRDHHRNADIPPESHVPGAPIHTGLRRAKYRSGNGFKRPERLSGSLAEGREERGS
jgi:DNA modification methylase